MKVIGKSLQTPTRIRSLQRKLYRKAKAEPAYRFYLLYDKICREDILRHAYALARSHAGAPGVDGVTFADIDLSGRKAWLAGLRELTTINTQQAASSRARKLLTLCAAARLRVLCLKLLSMLSTGPIKSQEHFVAFARKTFCTLCSRNAGANNDGTPDQAFLHSLHSGFAIWS